MIKLELLLFSFSLSRSIVFQKIFFIFFGALQFFRTRSWYSYSTLQLWKLSIHSFVLRKPTSFVLEVFSSFYLLSYADQTYNSHKNKIYTVIKKLDLDSVNFVKAIWKSSKDVWVLRKKYPWLKRFDTRFFEVFSGDRNYNWLLSYLFHWKIMIWQVFLHFQNNEDCNGAS